MEKFYLGSTIRHLRKKKKMTLDELAEGICSKRQLQRIETNTTIPSANMLTLISKKLNEDVSAYFPYSEYENPIEIHDLINELEKTLAYRDYEKLYHLTLPYFENIDKYPICFQQLIGYYYGSSCSVSHSIDIPEFQPEDYLKLLSLTFSYDSFDELCTTFKTTIEFRLSLAYIMLSYFGDVFPHNAHEHEENIKTGIKYLKLLLQSYLDNHLSLDSDLLGRIYNNIAHAYCLIDEYTNALKYVEKALTPEHYPKNLSVIAMLYYIKGNIYIYFDMQDEAIKSYKYFIMLFDLLGENDTMTPLINYIKTTYQI